MKSDLINRSELKIAVWMDVSKGTCGEYMDGSECSFTSNEVQKMIDEAPTVDAVEVVRCKDCWHHNNCGIEQAALAPIGFFCALGERKDDAK